MRYLLLSTLLAVGVLGGGGSAAETKPAAPSCKELQERRGILVKESALITSDVEAKNVELGEAADALKKATTQARKTELERRMDGLRRELNTLLDKEHSSTDQLGALDAQIAKQCLKGGKR